MTSRIFRFNRVSHLLFAQVSHAARTVLQIPDFLTLSIDIKPSKIYSLSSIPSGSILMTSLSLRSNLKKCFFSVLKRSIMKVNRNDIQLGLDELRKSATSTYIDKLADISICYFQFCTGKKDFAYTATVTSIWITTLKESNCCISKILERPAKCLGHSPINFRTAVMRQMQKH